MGFKEKACSIVARQRWMSKSLRLGLIRILFPQIADGFDFVCDFFGFVYRGNTRNLIDRKVLFSGCHECDVLAFIRDYLATIDSPVCLDIGANIGHHALFMSRYAHWVIAFEPYDPVRKSMIEKLDANNITNVTVLTMALGDVNEERQFFSPPDGNLGMGSFVEEFSEANKAAETLTVRRLDDLWPEMDVGEIDFIKLDIEGFEKEALTGARQTLLDLRPTVLFESSVRLDNALHDMDEISRIFPEGYRYFRFTHTGKRRKGMYRLVPLNQDMIDSRDELTILAVPSERDVPHRA